MQLEEITVEQHPRILKAYLMLAPDARPYMSVDKEAPVEAFVATAPQFPGFRVLVESGTHTVKD